MWRGVSVEAAAGPPRLPPRWLKAEWLSAACEVRDQNGAVVAFVDAVVTGRELFEWLRRVKFPGLRMSQYRSAVRRMLDPPGPGYAPRTDDLDANLVALLHANLFRVGKQPWCTVNAYQPTSSPPVFSPTSPPRPPRAAAPAPDAELATASESDLPPTPSTKRGRGGVDVLSSDEDDSEREQADRPPKHRSRVSRAERTARPDAAGTGGTPGFAKEEASGDHALPHRHQHQHAQMQHLHHQHAVGQPLAQPLPLEPQNVPTAPPPPAPPVVDPSAALTTSQSPPVLSPQAQQLQHKHDFDSDLGPASRGMDPSIYADLGAVPAPEFLHHAQEQVSRHEDEQMGPTDRGAPVEMMMDPFPEGTHAIGHHYAPAPPHDHFIGQQFPSPSQPMAPSAEPPYHGHRQSAWESPEREPAIARRQLEYTPAMPSHVGPGPAEHSATRFTEGRHARQHHHQVAGPGVLREDSRYTSHPHESDRDLSHALYQQPRSSATSGLTPERLQQVQHGLGDPHGPGPAALQDGMGWARRTEYSAAQHRASMGPIERAPLGPAGGDQHFDGRHFFGGHPHHDYHGQPRHSLSEPAGAVYAGPASGRAARPHSPMGGARAGQPDEEEAVWVNEQPPPEELALQGPFWRAVLPRELLRAASERLGFSWARSVDLIDRYMRSMTHYFRLVSPAGGAGPLPASTRAALYEREQYLRPLCDRPDKMVFMAGRTLSDILYCNRAGVELLGADPSQARWPVLSHSAALQILRALVWRAVGCTSAGDVEFYGPNDGTGMMCINNLELCPYDASMPRIPHRGYLVMDPTVSLFLFWAVPRDDACRCLHLSNLSGADRFVEARDPLLLREDHH